MRLQNFSAPAGKAAPPEISAQNCLSEARVDLAKTPPAAQKFFAIGAIEFAAELFDLAVRFEVALEFVA